MMVHRVGPILEAVQWLGPHATEQPPWLRGAMEQGAVVQGDTDAHIYRPWKESILVKKFDFFVMQENGYINCIPYDEYIDRWMAVKGEHVVRASYADMPNKEDKHEGS